ncbi:biotin--[acetyl-CoA-carboxylase] ligase [Polymorphobacter arshaanensis]|uniref:biotin--[acetyl-CoA-carboxylase] ligase n=1 Tax=Glacieibacterium arshaanense TaxID=2511025 RepID=UPI001FB0BC8D|nr:biotin--[acetyl-CoA-carboxylase] ligase [Polymorphobacter arshaanensis]
MTSTLVEFDEIGSTNDWLATQDGAADGLWVRATRQSGGRGRRGRAWSSLEGNLFISVLTRPQAGEGPSQQLSFVAAVALDRALQQWVPSAHLALKWPNDLLLIGIKVSGILLEGSDGATIIGFGVNLVAHPADTERPATSLLAQGYAAPSAHDLAIALMEAFDATRTAWRDYGFDSIRNAWLARAAGLGAPLVARLGSETLTGTFDGLDTDGALRLRFDDGSSRAIHAGEVFQL